MPRVFLCVPVHLHAPLQSFLAGQFDALATDRVCRAFVHLGQSDAAMRTLRAYSDWIELIGRRENRTALRDLTEATRHESALFEEVARIGAAIDNGLAGVMFESGLSQIAPRYLVL